LNNFAAQLNRLSTNDNRLFFQRTS